MTEASDTVAEPLLRTVTAEQRKLLEIVGDALARSGDWPIYQYVQAKMDDDDLDIDSVLRTMPVLTDGGSLRYSLVRRDRTGGDDTPIALSVVGMAHLEQFATTVSMFLRALARLAVERAAAQYEPQLLVEAVVPSRSWSQIWILLRSHPSRFCVSSLDQNPRPGTARSTKKAAFGLFVQVRSYAASGVSTVLRIMSPGCARG